jgi:hypothetical protein
MKLDKRFVFGAALLLGLGMNISGCGDDGDDNNGNECKVTKESCEKDGKDFDKDKCECKAKAEECKVTKESCEKDGKEFDAENCRCNTVKAETCGNNKLDEGEICDTVDGEVKFADGKGTCQLWYDENKDKETAPLVDDPEAKPGCASGCTAHSMGSCKTEAKVLCGNGQIDDGEVCDIGIDGQAKTDDDVVTGKTCNDYQEGNWKEGGKPSCAKDCKSLGGGFGDTKCVSADVVEEVNGIVSCEASITIAEDKATGNAEVVAKDGKSVSGAIVCGSLNAGLAPLISKLELSAATDGKHSSEISIADFKDKGNYGCFYYVKAADQDNGVFCSTDGTVTSNTEKTVDDIKLVTFDVAGEVTEGTLATWTFNNYNIQSDKTKIAEDMKTGLVPEEGTGSDIKLLWNEVTGVDVSVSLTKATTTTALQIKNADTTNGNWAATQTKDTNPSLVIDVANYVISKVAMTASYGKNGGKVYITGETASSESVIKELDLTGSYAQYEIDSIASDVVKVHLYGSNGNGSAINIDDITLVGAAK